MSTEHEVTDQNSQQAGESGNSEELSDALAGTETEFVTSEKKATNTGALFVLLLVVAAGGGLYLMYKRSGPAPASAASVEAAKADETINTFLTSGPSGIKMMQEMLKNTEKVVKQFLDYPSMNQVPLSDLRTNPFRFAAARGENPTADAEAARKKREEERLAALKAVQGLTLQSIIHSGSHKACMVNNTMYLEGQQIENFTIEKITPSSVVVKTGTYRFELKMQK